MRNILFRRLFCLSLCLMMVIGVSALAQRDDKIAAERTKFTVLVEQDPNVTDYDDNNFTKYLEEHCNIDIEFIVLPTDEGVTKFSLMVNAGNKLPDIVLLDKLDGSSVLSYGASGVFIPLNKYFADKDASYYLHKLGEKFTEQLPYLMSADGNYYGVPLNGELLTDIYSRKIWINKTWLDMYGLEIPKTTEEFKPAMQTFVTRDPNGNGKADEIGYMGTKASWSAISEDALMNAFVYADPTNGYLFVEDGKVHAAYASDGWRKGCEYMSELVKLGCYDPISFTQDTTALRGIVRAADGLIAGAVAGNNPGFAYEDSRMMEYVALEPLTGPDGVSYIGVANHGVAKPFGFITSDCANPDAAYKFLDFFYNPDTYMTGRYGRKDVDWKVSTDKKGIYEDTLIPFEIINETWNMPSNDHWGNMNPRLSGDWLCSSATDGVLAQNKGDFYYLFLMRSIEKWYGKHQPKEILFRVTYTSEENEEIYEMFTTLKSYVKEMQIAFITGNKELNDATWNEYLNELKNIGLERYLEVTQTAYERMGKSK